MSFQDSNRPDPLARCFFVSAVRHCLRQGLALGGVDAMRGSGWCGGVCRGLMYIICIYGYRVYVHTFACVFSDTHIFNTSSTYCCSSAQDALLRSEAFVQALCLFCRYSCRKNVDEDVQSIPTARATPLTPSPILPISLRT